MRSIVVSLALLIFSSGQLQNEGDNEEHQLERNNSSRDQSKAEKQQRLDERPWLLQNSCYAALPLPTNETIYHCTTPASDLSCFGMPIDYVYVPSREALPVEYEVLRRFPKCWKAIGPMLCGIVFRPCTVSYTEKKMATEIQRGKGELWLRFEASACRKVIEECEDAIKERIFPSDLINCTRSAGESNWKDERNNTKGTLARFGPYRSEKELSTEWELQTFFTEDKCKYPYQKENSPQLEPMQCIFPLIYTDHARIRPVIDKCFLPCRNPLISSHATFLSFSVFRVIVCFALAAICLAIFLYLACRSSIFVDSDAVFSMAFCLLSFSVYLLCWGAGSIPFLAEASECTLAQHDVSIRNTLLDSNWCFLISAVTHVSLLSSIGFLAASYALSAAAASKADARDNERDTSDSSSSPFLRFCLVIGIVIMSSSIGMIAYRLNMMSTDGVAGVCSIGLHSIIDQLLVVAAPGLAYCLIALGWGAWHSWKAKKNREAEIEEKIQEAIAEEKNKIKTEHSKKEGAKREEKEEEQRDGEDEILVLRGDEEEISEEQKKQLSEMVRADLRAEWRDRKQRAYRGGISSKHTLVALCLCLYSLIFGLFVHFITLANDGNGETEAVLGYVRCVMTRSILSKDLRWMHNTAHAAEVWANGTAETDPFVRRHLLESDIDIDTCVYPSTGGFRRMFGLIFVFIVLPLLPIGVFIWAFIAGCAGVGGMAMVKKQRKKAQSAAFDDVEMMTLTTEHVEDHGHHHGTDMENLECKSKCNDLESGQLAPRDVVASCPLEDDTDAISLQSAARRILSGAISSDQSSISKVEKTMIRNMKRIITRTLNEADERGMEVPQRLQLLQEELVLRALPWDEASGSGTDNQQEQQSEIFVDVLNAARSSLLQPFVQDPLFAEIANRGMLLSGQTIALARLANSNGTINSRSINYYVLQLAINRIHQLAYHLLHREAPTPELIADIETAIRATFLQMDLNCMTNADELLTSQQSIAQFDFDVNDDEDVQERIKLYVEAYNEQPPEILEQLITNIVAARNRRYASLLMARQRERRFATAAIALEQHQRMQMNHVDQQLPLEGMGGRPTLLEHQEELLRQYHETHLQPLHCTGPSTNNGATSDSSSDVFQFMSHVMRMNGRSMPQTGPSTEPSTPSINGRSALPVGHTVALADNMQQPSTSAMEAASSAVQQLHQETNIPRLFPWLGDDGGQLPPVLVFPGSRSTAQLHLTLQEQQNRMAAAAATAASAAAEPKAPQDTTQHPKMPDAPNHKLKRKAEVELLAEDSPKTKRESPSPPAAAVNDELMHEHHQQPGSSNELMTMSAEALVPSEGGGRETADDAEDDLGSGSEEYGGDSPTSSILNQNFVQLEIGEDGEGNTGIPDDYVVVKDEMMEEEIAGDGGEEDEEKSINDEERLQSMNEKHSNTDIVVAEGEEDEEEEEVEEEEAEEEKEKDEEEEEEEEEQKKDEQEEEEEENEKENKMKMENEQREDDQRKEKANIEERDKQQIDRDSGIVDEVDVETGSSQSDASISSRRLGETVIRTSEAEVTLESV